MAQFSQQEQNQLRLDAARRVREMQQRVSPPMRPRPYYGAAPPPRQKQPISPPPSRNERPMPPPISPQHQPSGHHPADQRQGSSHLSSNLKGTPLLGCLPGLDATELLSRLDGDSMLIIALMVMLYKNGGEEIDKKLLMALAYLLT